MSRTRFIKPGFFVNDTLAEVHPLGRLLFAGLWTIADRAGRLEDRPKRIKAELLPFDDVDVDQLLWELADRGFITRYESAGDRLIQIEGFPRHQSPHPKEPASKWAGPEPKNAESVISHSPDTDKTTSSQADPLTFSTYLLHSPSPPTAAGVQSATGRPRGGGDGFKRVIAVLERMGAKLNPLAYDDVGGLVDEGYRPDWFEQACAVASTNNKPTWAYARAVLLGWGLDGPPAPRERKQGNGRDDTLTAQKARAIAGLKGDD